MRTFESLPQEHKTHLTGKYNRGVYSCLDCDYNPFKIGENHFDNIIGFAKSNDEVMIVCECPKCFEKWFCHARLKRNDDVYDRDTYDYFLDTIKANTNKHHNESK